MGGFSSFSISSVASEKNVVLKGLTFSVRPTIFFIRKNHTLEQLVKIIINNSSQSMDGELQITIQSRKFTYYFKPIRAGNYAYPIFLPEVKAETPVSFMLTTTAGFLKYQTKLRPQRHWTVHLLQHSHTDLGYTKLQPLVYRDHADILDKVLEYCKATDHYPEGSKFKWNVEVSWQVENYIKRRPPQKVRELMAFVKKKRIEIGAWYVQQSDLFAHEEIIRSLYPAKELQKKFKVPLISAMSNDVTGFSWSAPQLLSQAGIKYFTVGINEDRARVPLTKPLPFYWKSPDGKKILVWNGEHYLFANRKLHLHESYEESLPRVERYLDYLEQQRHYPYDIIGLHISGYPQDNSPPNQKISDVVRTWNKHWAYPKLKLSLMHEFFNDLKKSAGRKIPTYQLAWPDYWTDGAASAAFETGINRITHTKLLAAETWATVASVLNNNFNYPRQELQETYRQTMLFDEHTWGAKNSIREPESPSTKGQWAIKSSFAYTAKAFTDQILDQSIQSLSTRIPGNGKFSFAVLNPLSWERTDRVDINLPEEFNSKERKFKVIDCRTHKVVPFQWTNDRTIFFIAHSVPSMGYTLYQLIPEKHPPKAIPAFFNPSDKIENSFYQITIDKKTGGLVSIRDKELNLELVDNQSPYKLNQYIYENPEGNRKDLANMKKRIKFDRFSPTSINLLPGLNGPVASSIIIKTSARPCPEIRQEIILYRDLKRIDIINELLKEKTYQPEALYFAFPFNIKNGKFKFEISNGQMSPESDQLPNTVRDWYGLQNWCEIANRNYRVIWSPIEAPLVQFGDINTGKWLTKLEIRNTTLFSYAMNNYWHTNFKAGQGGKITFRYSITSLVNGSNLQSAPRFGWEQHQPLQVVWLSGEDNNSPSKKTSQSFLTVDRPNVIIQSFKRAEDKNGFILRLREIEGTESRPRVTLPLLKKSGIKHIALTDIAENNIKAIPGFPYSFLLTMKPFSIQTIRLF